MGSSDLPLKQAWFHILLCLADGPRHGYAIRADTEERTEGRVTLWPATLYGSIREMEEEGLIARSEAPHDPDDPDNPGGAADDGSPDARRNYYELTPEGRDLLRAETGRLEALVDAARATRALREA